ncbi:MAG TPA: hypothetical protein VGG83_10725 [Trebonia sp.]|jgi:hypothetical protein
MPQFPVPVADRFGKLISTLVARVRRLEQRCQVLDTGNFVVPYLATISSGYVSGDPTVVLNGQSIGPLQHLSSYTPTAGATVLLIPVGQTYIVAGTPV